MSGPLDNMSSLAAANSEAGLQQQLHSPELWRRLQLFRLAVVSSSSGEPTAESRDKRTKLVLGLLKDVELRVLFVAVDFCHGQAGDEVKQGAVEVALLSVLGSSVGQKLLQENNADLVPFFLAGLCHPTPGVKKLTAKALLTLGLGGAGGGGGGERVQLDEDGGRSTRCRQLLQPPLLPALVAALGDGDTGAAQAMADTLLSLCEEADRPHATGAAGAASGEALACRRAVLGALASQVGEVVAGLTARQASIPKLRFADTAARLMSVSDSAFSAALDAGALPLVTDLTEDASDVLIQLNALELLEQVASTAGGARHLVAKGHLDRLLVSAGGGGGSDPETPDPLLGASALRTLAKVLAKAEGVGLDVWRERRSSFMAGFLRACAVHLEGRDEAGKLAGLVAASTAAEASNDALKAMLAQNHGAEGGVLDAWLTLSAHKVEVKAAALHAVSLVLSTPPSPATPTRGYGQHDGRYGGGRGGGGEGGGEGLSSADAVRAGGRLQQPPDDGRLAPRPRAAARPRDSTRRLRRVAVHGVAARRVGSGGGVHPARLPRLHPRARGCGVQVYEGVEVFGGGVHHGVQGAGRAWRGAPRLLSRDAKAGTVLCAGQEERRCHSGVGILTAPQLEGCVRPSPMLHV